MRERERKRERAVLGSWIYTRRKVSGELLPAPPEIGGGALMSPYEGHIYSNFNYHTHLSSTGYHIQDFSLSVIFSYKLTSTNIINSSLAAT